MNHYTDDTQEQPTERQTLKVPLTFYHVAPRSRRESILANGLEIGHPVSGIPYARRRLSKTSDAIWLYADLAKVSFLPLLENVGLQWDVYQVTQRYQDGLIKEHGRLARNWRASVTLHNTVGSTVNIAKEDVVHLFSVDGSNQALRK